MNENEIQNVGKEGNKKVQSNDSVEELSDFYEILFEILLIVQMIVLFIMFVFFGLNHIVLFVASITITIRMFIGVKDKRPDYFKKGLFFFIWCFVAHVIKIIFRFLLTFFIYKKHDIDNLKDMNIIETNTILWIKGFDIKLNGILTIIFLAIFMIFWIILIILFSKKKNCFNYIDQKVRNEYNKIIDEFYQDANFGGNDLNNVEIDNNGN